MLQPSTRRASRSNSAFAGEPPNVQEKCMAFGLHTHCTILCTRTWPSHALKVADEAFHTAAHHFASVGYMVHVLRSAHVELPQDMKSRCGIIRVPLFSYVVPEARPHDHWPKGWLKFVWMMSIIRLALSLIDLGHSLT